MFHGINGHGIGMGFGWIIGLFILIVAIIIIIYALRQNGSTKREVNKTSLEILKERYARGEIDKAEFDDRKKDL